MLSAPFFGKLKGQEVGSLVRHTRVDAIGIIKRESEIPLEKGMHYTFIVEFIGGDENIGRGSFSAWELEPIPKRKDTDKITRSMPLHEYVAERIMKKQKPLPIKSNGTTETVVRVNP